MMSLVHAKIKFLFGKIMKIRILPSFLLLAVLLGCGSMPKTHRPLLQLEGKEVTLKQEMDLHLSFVDQHGNTVSWFVGEDGTIDTEKVKYPYPIGFGSTKMTGPLPKSFKPHYTLEEVQFRPNYQSGSDHFSSTKAYWVLVPGTKLEISKVKNEWGLDTGNTFTYVYGRVARPDNAELVDFKFLLYGEIVNLPW